MTEDNVTARTMGEDRPAPARGGSESGAPAKPEAGVEGSPGTPPAGTDGDPAAGGVGASLRAARIARRMTVPQVVTALKMRQPYVVAIEDGRYADLPGTAYALGFVRAYAELVGLNSHAMVRQLKDELAGRGTRSRLSFPSPPSEGRVPGGTILLLSFLIAGVIYSGWYYLSATDRTVADLVPPLPQHLMALLEPAPAVAPGGTPGPAIAAPPAASAAVRPVAAAGDAHPPAGPPGLAAEPRAKSGAVADPDDLPPLAEAGDPAPLPESDLALMPGMAGGAAADPVPAAEAAEDEEETPAVDLPAPSPGAGVAGVGAAAGAAAGGAAGPEAGPGADAPPPPPPPPAAVDPLDGVTRMFGPENTSSRILLRARDDTWVQVREGRGRTLFSRVLTAGDAYRVPDRPGIVLRTGNAGGLEVLVDGQKIPALGNTGQVLRSVPMDPERLRGGAAPGSGPARP